MLKHLLAVAAVVVCLGEQFYVPMPQCDDIPGGSLGGKCERENCFVPISGGREMLLYTCDAESDGTGSKGYVYYQVPPHVKVWESKFPVSEGEFRDTGADPHVRSLANGGSTVSGVSALGVDSTDVAYAGGDRTPQWTREFLQPAEVEQLGSTEKIRFKVRENSACETVGANIRFLDYRDRALVELSFGDKATAASGNWELLLNGQVITVASDSVWYDVEFDVDWVAKNLTTVLLDDAGNPPTLAAEYIPFANLGATPPVRKIELFNLEKCNSYWGDMIMYSKKVPLWTPME